jgi:hypothetical protein
MERLQRELTAAVSAYLSGEALKLLAPALADADQAVDEAAEWMRTVRLMCAIRRHPMRFCWPTQYSL